MNQKTNIQIPSFEIELPDVSVGEGLVSTTNTSYDNYGNPIESQMISVEVDDSLNVGYKTDFDINGATININSVGSLSAMPLVMSNIEINGYRTYKVYKKNGIISLMSDEEQKLFRALLITEPEGELRFELEGLVLEGV
jgi:hypothetical protein